MSPKNESENRDSGKVDKRKRIPKYQSKIDNPEKLATQGTHDEDKQSKNTAGIYVGHHYAQINTNYINKT